jgi:hypothetical protein
MNQENITAVNYKVTRFAWVCYVAFVETVVVCWLNNVYTVMFPLFFFLTASVDNAAVWVPLSIICNIPNTSQKSAQKTRNVKMAANELNIVPF